MERMANVEFESRGMIDPPKLAAAVNQLLATPLMPDDFAGEEYEYPAAVMGYALEELDFLDRLDALRCTLDGCGSGLSVPVRTSTSLTGTPLVCVHCGGEWEAD